ncbi:hypothetical protein [Halovenus sp. HT40]|uniref:hypothetical protein n=1 Tax=Halovenus sp. HT40 TaxID=3126691 RepID=UPI00300F3E28
MALLSAPEESPAASGLVAGGAAYLLGVAVIVGTALAGVAPATGVWERSDGIGYLLVHHAAHLPVWQFTVQWPVVPYTVVLATVLVVAGFVVTQHVRDRVGTGFRTGSSIAVGYVPVTLIVSVALVLGHGAITPIRMMAPTLLVGIVIPGLLGGIGGVLSDRYDRRTAGVSQS